MAVLAWLFRTYPVPMAALAAAVSYVILWRHMKPLGRAVVAGVVFLTAVVMLLGR